MSERRSTPRGRTFRGGQIVLHSGKSTIDCRVRNISEDGACLEVQSAIGIPDRFDLVIAGETEPRHCKLAWQAANRIGVSFAAERTEGSTDQPAAPERAHDLVRSEMLALRAAFDEVRFGLVLLDHELRAQFINRAFRKIWRLPNAKADAKPPFVALMYHGRETKAYEVPAGDLDEYIAERVAQVKAGAFSRDLRLSNGEVLRLDCAVLPNGGRMLSYTSVTDIVRHSDELELLRASLDKVNEGIILLDSDLRASFINRAARDNWKMPEELIASRPSYAEIVEHGRRTGMYNVPPDQIDAFVARRVALLKVGDPTPQDFRASNGRHIRSQCAVLPDGGRMLTYSDVTDLVRHAEQLEEFATIDSMTGFYNRRHFLVLAAAEFERFQRYQRPLSMLMVDIDHFKSINDRFGRAVGDRAIELMTRICQASKRNPDIVGRVGGEEFALLLPETDIEQAHVVARRICAQASDQSMTAAGVELTLSLSIGLAAATLSMSGIEALMGAADQALYRAKTQDHDRVVEFMPTIADEAPLAAE